MEKELWGLLGGGWALGGGRGADFRRAWVRAVREAEGPAQLAPRLLEIEAALPMCGRGRGLHRWRGRRGGGAGGGGGGVARGGGGGGRGRGRVLEGAASVGVPDCACLRFCGVCVLSERLCVHRLPPN